MAAKKNRGPDDDDATLEARNKPIHIPENRDEPKELKFEAPDPEIGAYNSLKQMTEMAKELVAENAKHNEEIRLAKLDGMET